MEQNEIDYMISFCEKAYNKCESNASKWLNKSTTTSNIDRIPYYTELAANWNKKAAEWHIRISEWKRA